MRAGKIDDLQLTGALRTEGTNDETYLIRNLVYESCLRDHFSFDRLLYVLTLGGSWKEALDYLVAYGSLSENDHDIRTALLAIGIQAIYASSSLRAASINLARTTYAAFKVSCINVYIADRHRSCLELLADIPDQTSLIPSIPLIEKGSKEIVAYFRDDDSFWRYSDEEVRAVPIFCHDYARLGLVTVRIPHYGHTDSNIVELLRFLRHAGGAVGAVRERQDRKLLQKTLHKMGKRVGSYLELEEILKTTADAAVTAISGAQEASIFLWNNKMDRLEIAYPNETISNGASSATCIPDAVENAFRNGELQVMTHAVSIPLSIWGGTIGVLYLTNLTVKNAFHNAPSELLNFVNAFLNQAVAAIERSWLMERLGKIHDIYSKLSSVTDLGSIASPMAEQIARLIGAARSVFYLIDPMTLSVTPKGFRYRRSDLTEQEFLESVSGWCAQVGQAAIISDPQNDERNKGTARQTVIDLKITCQLVAPVIVKGKTIAVFVACNKMGGVRFRDDDLQLVILILSPNSQRFVP